MPGVETVARRPLRQRRLALRAGAAQRPRPSRRAYGVQGRRRPRHARSSPKRSRMSAAILNAWTARDQTDFHGRALAARSAAGRRADRRPGPRARISTTSISSARSRSCCPELGEVHGHAGRPRPRSLFEAAFDGQPLGRPVLGDERAIRGDHAGRICLDWLRAAVSCRRGLILVGERQGRRR